MTRAKYFIRDEFLVSRTCSPLLLLTSILQSVLDLETERSRPSIVLYYELMAGPLVVG